MSKIRQRDGSQIIIMSNPQGSNKYASSRPWENGANTWKPPTWASTDRWSRPAEQPARTDGHSQELTPFNKDFYKEHPAVRDRSDEEILRFKEQAAITTFGQDVPKPCFSFEEANFPSSIIRTVETAGFTAPTPIQSQGWPVALSGKDMIGIAQTGSGKTLSFLLPALIHIADQTPLSVSYI